MTTRSHTPEPWVISTDYHDDGGGGEIEARVGSKGGGVHIATVYNHGRANAPLIRAAPKMLALLRECNLALQNIPADYTYSPRVGLRADVRAGIADAEGGGA